MLHLLEVLLGRAHAERNAPEAGTAEGHDESCHLEFFSEPYLVDACCGIKPGEDLELAKLPQGMPNEEKYASLPQDDLVEAGQINTDAILPQ